MGGTIVARTVRMLRCLSRRQLLPLGVQVLVGLCVGASMSCDSHPRSRVVDITPTVDLVGGHKAYPIARGMRCLRQGCTLPLPPKVCGLNVKISRVLVDPVTLPDAQGEWVELTFPMPPTSLYGWTLQTSRATRELSTLPSH